MSNASASIAPHLKWGQLVWSHFSRPRFDPLPARIAAAGAAGFAGIGLYTHAFGKWLDDGHDVVELRDLLNGAGVVIGEAEAMRGWWADSGPQAEEAAQVERWVTTLAKQIGVRYLQVIGSHEVPIDVAADRFGALCDRMSELGVLVGIEWLPFTNITTPQDAQRIVQAADRPNGGYCVDIWHHVRGTGRLEDVLSLEPERIFSVQVSDGTLHPADADYKRDCLANRVVPGAGEFGCAEFISALRSHGVTAPLSAEVCSGEMWALSANDAATRSAESLRAVLWASENTN